jgi:hypothetical protein
MRRSGQTTRIVDAAIQELFTAGSVIIKDHHPTIEADRHAYLVFRRRLKDEHNIGSEDLIISEGNRFTIQLKKNESTSINNAAGSSDS